MRKMEETNSVFERCAKCDALLDISGCTPLTETICPSCGGLIKVLTRFHHYVLLSKLGQGGSGTVYRAFDNTLERDVALKLLRNEFTHDPVYLDALEKEAVITASLRHPRIVKVFAAGQKDGFYFIAMEIVNGGTLEEKIRQLGRLPEAVALSVTIKIAEGLDAAAKCGLLHRDVKPGNVLFADDGLEKAVKVADFGLAQPVSQSANVSADLWGTPAYMSPEKLQREGEDSRSDIYSLGCTLFHCLTGRPPFASPDVDELVLQQVSTPAPNVQVFAPDVSGATAFVIERCLKKDPNERYQNYEELIEHLSYVEGQSLTSEAAAPAKKARPRQEVGAGGRNRSQWMTVAAMAVSFLAVAVVGVFAFMQKDPKPAAASAPSASAGAKAPAVAKAVFRVVDLRSAFNADTRRSLFSENATAIMVDSLVFSKYGIIQANGVPFELVNPEQNLTAFNIMYFRAPAKVEVQIPPQTVRKFHFLGGIAGDGWSESGGKNNKNLGVPLIRFKVVHAGEQAEVFEFKNGVEFSNHYRRIDVPGSLFADGVVTNGHQIRTFSVALANTTPVKKLVIESLAPKIFPVIVAITAEDGPQQ